MAEPENHTLCLLREFREEFSEYRNDFNAFRRDTRAEIVDFRSESGEQFADIKVRLDSLARAFAGEIVQSRYASAAIYDRFAEIERRFSALEQSR